MNAAGCRRIALSLEGAEEGSHLGAADFRVGGKIFATLTITTTRLWECDAHSRVAGDLYRSYRKFSCQCRVGGEEWE